MQQTGRQPTNSYKNLVLPRIKNLESELQDQIHPNLNDLKAVEGLTAYSRTSIWWKGRCGHSWQAKVEARTLGAGCPFCSGREVLERFNDLNTTHPKIAAQWHPVKNRDKLPTQVSYGHRQKVWWLDEFNHEWEMSVASRTTGGQGCPFCANKRILFGFNDLATTAPNLAAQWSNKNDFPASEALAGSARKVWWEDDHFHQWEARINSRLIGKGSCPYCSGYELLLGFNDLGTIHPELVSDWSNDNNKPIAEVLPRESDKKKWICKKGHEWEATIYSRVHGHGCPYCSGLKPTLGVKDLTTTNPEVAKGWHPTKNKIDINKVSATTVKPKIWWVGTCGHEWEKSIPAQIAFQGACPFCANKKLLAGFNDIATTHPKLMKEIIEDELEIPLTSLMANSRESRQWKCVSGHKTEQKIFARVKSGCPKCSHLVGSEKRRIPASGKSLEELYPEIAGDWITEKNVGLPINFKAASPNKKWWRCSEGHEWEARISDRVYHLSGCPVCSASKQQSAGELELLKYLESLGVNPTHSRKDILPFGYELDLYVSSLKIGIEFNGVYWHSEKFKHSNYHHRKWLEARKLGIQLIQIWEDDWNNKPDLIKAMLAHKLGLSRLTKIYARKTKIISVKTKIAEAFLEQNHIQGFASGSYYLGLEFEGELVSLMVLKQERKGEFNLIRYATSALVVGGFTKLLSNAEKALPIKKIVTFSDNCVSDGSLYANNGFIADKELAADYMYVIKGQRKHKFGYRSKRFKNDPNLLWKDKLTEKELAELNSLPRIWDAGKTRWVKSIDSTPLGKG